MFKSSVKQGVFQQFGWLLALLLLLAACQSNQQTVIKPEQNQSRSQNRNKNNSKSLKWR